MAEGIRKKGKGYTFRIPLKVDGKWKDIERGGFRTIAEAKAARDTMKAELKNNKNILKEDIKISLENVYDTFITKEAKYDREKSTLKRYDSLFRNHLNPIWGNRTIGSIDACELTDYLFSKTESLSYAYIESIHKFIKVIWNFAEERKFTKENIITKVKMPKKPKKEEIVPYTESQLNLFEQQLETTNLITAFKLGRALGLRIAENFGLLWSDIDWDKRTIKIERQLVFEDKIWTLRKPKTEASERVINLQNSIYEYLKALKSEQETQKNKLGIAYRPNRVAIDKGKNKDKVIVDDLDFINIKPSGQLLTPDSGKIIARTIKKNLNKSFKYHNLRHTHASMLAEKNVPLVLVKTRLGHSKEETTLKY